MLVSEDSGTVGTESNLVGTLGEERHRLLDVGLQLLALPIGPVDLEVRGGHLQSEELLEEFAIWVLGTVLICQRKSSTLSSVILPPPTMLLEASLEPFMIGVEELEEMLA